MTRPHDSFAERVEAARRFKLVEGCKKIDNELGAAVEEAFNAGYSAEQVHRMLSGSLALTEEPALRTQGDNT
ncbi:hypothetical protein [Aurantiacibacter spongiae]|uniref:Uncharacterized protein n=1 Tax=Aurantiacibacter spongiae TaxID=2488860 RepID=A0A3N5D7G8_9SPHN|nr:hypothetical protein [Aurantiacibacter spongiae]RPF70478.1 hypothetical protein EG799_01665 [Aurantiacibacter spongiae]